MSGFPREYLFLEGEIQQLVRNALDRGRVEVNVTVQNLSAAAFLVDANLARGYMEAAERLKQEFDLQDSLDLKTILGLPGILQNRRRLRKAAGFYRNWSKGA